MHLSLDLIKNGTWNLLLTHNQMAGLVASWDRYIGSYSRMGYVTSAKPPWDIGESQNRDWNSSRKQQIDRRARFAKIDLPS